MVCHETFKDKSGRWVEPSKVIKERGKYFIPSPSHLHEGILDVNSQGNGYLMSEELDDDVFIDSRHFNKAFHGDTVSFKITTSRGKRRKQGVVVNIIKRKQTHYVGVIERFDDVFAVQPKQINIPFLLSKLNISLGLLKQLNESILKSFPKVTGASQMLSKTASQTLMNAIAIAKKQGDEYVATEHILLAIYESGSEISKILQDQGVTKTNLNKVIQELRKGEKIPEGQRSIALNVTIQSSEKTLKDEDLDRINQLIISTVENKTGAKIRS